MKTTLGDWLYWAFCAACSVALVLIAADHTFAQSRPVMPAEPVVRVYELTLTDSSRVQCAIVDHYGGLAIDCGWSPLFP